MPRRATTRNGRQRKLSCDRCGFICYASAGAVIRAGVPVCGCGAPMTVANPRDLAVIDPDGFDALAGAMPTRSAFNALMRECGYTDSIIRDRSSDPMARARAAASRRATMARRAAAAEMPF